MNLITIYGIRRSGNHAVANWILSHYNKGCYINDANRQIRQSSNWLPCYKHLSNQTNLDNSPDIIVIGIENKTDRFIHQLYLDKIKQIYTDQHIHNTEICLLRHCPNLIASHLQAWPDKTYHENIPNHWKEYITFYKNDTNDVLQLVYDYWLDQSYRNSFATTIGFTNLDNGIDHIPHYGGGSSFKDKVVDHKALKNRWKNMITNDRFNNIMKKFDYWADHIEIFGTDECYLHYH